MSTTKFGIMLKVFIASLMLAGLVSASVHTVYAQAPNAAAPPASQNNALSTEQRVKDLISRMTLDEKVRQMQHTAPAIPRLGIPSYDWWSEALHGVARAGYATVFPQAIGMAATWDADLVHSEGRVIAIEGRAKYYQAQRENNHFIYFGLTFWSPNINIFRDPRWGRGQETYGEDPFLTAKLGTAFVKGVQGDDPHYFEAIATPKHYAVHSGPEMMRHGFDVKPSAHDLEDTYLPAFRATVVEGHADSVMCAYNAINGEPACANTYLLQKTLRDDWKFQGFVTSDCGAVEDFVPGHHFSADLEHAAAAAVRAGTDTTCGEEYVTLVKAVGDGLIKESELDIALRAPLHRAISPGHVRCAGHRPFPRHSSFPDRLAGTSPAGASGGTRVHGVAEESGGHPAFEPDGENPRRHWPQCGIVGDAGRKLQRYTEAPGVASRWPAQAVRGQSRGALRARLALRNGTAGPVPRTAFQTSGSGRGRRPQGRVFRQSGLLREAGGGARRSADSV